MASTRAGDNQILSPSLTALSRLQQRFEVLDQGIKKVTLALIHTRIPIDAQKRNKERDEELWDWDEAIKKTASACHENGFSGNTATSQRSLVRSLCCYGWSSLRYASIDKPDNIKNLPFEVSIVTTPSGRIYRKVDEHIQRIYLHF